MPTVDEIRTITIQGMSEGMDKAVADVNALAKAQDGLTVVSDKSTRAQTSVANALNRQQMSLDTSYRATVNFNKAQLDITRGYNEGLISLDRYNQLTALNQDRLDKATNSQGLFQKTLSGVQGQLVALAAGAGPVGTALAALGPVGLAAAAGLKITSDALDYLKNQAEEAGRWAVQIRNVANVLQLTTPQVQALNEVAGNFGIAANDNATAFQRFSVGVSQLKDGVGQLYTELAKVNPQLAAQISVAKNTAQAWDLLAQAYANADDKQRALLARAAFGRGGLPQGQVLLATNNAGGLSALTAAQEDAVSERQIQQWATLTTQINNATESASHNFQSIFTTQILQNQKNFADGMLSISRAARDFALSDDAKAWISFLSNPTVQGVLLGAATGAAGGALFGGPIGSLIGAGVGAAVGAGSGAAYSAVSTRGANAANQPIYRSPYFDQVFSGAMQASQAAKPGMDALTQGSSPFQASQARDLVAALGSAATAADRYDATIKQLRADHDQGKLTADQFAKAIAGAGLDYAIQRQNAYNSAVGDFATTADLVTAKALALAKANQQGAGISGDMAAKIENQVRATNDWNVVNAQAQIGVFNVATATKAAGEQFQSWIDHKYLDPNNPEQFAAAMQAIANKTQAASDAAKVAGSAFPQLTQLGLDAGNLNKQLDTAGTGILNSFSDGLVSVANHSATAGDAIRNFGTQAITALQKLAIQMAIIAPIAKGLQSVFGFSLFGFSGGGAVDTGSSANPLPGLTAADYGPGFDTGGFTGIGPSLKPAGIVHAGEYVFDAVSTSMIGVSRLDSMRRSLRGLDGGGPVSNVIPLPGLGQDSRPMSFTYAPKIDARGADAQAVARLSKGLADDRKNFEKNAIAVNVKYRQNNPGAA